MTDWTSAIAIVLAGAIVGATFIYFMRRKRAMIGDPELRDLHAKRDALVNRLRESRLDSDTRSALEIETAQMLRGIDEVERRATPPVDGGRGRPPLRGVLIGFASGVASTLLLGGLVYFVMQSAKPREGAPAQPAVDASVQQLEAAIQKSPDDLNARVELARAYLDRNNLMGVFDQTRYVLAKSPGDSRALTYQAVVRMAMGQRDEAVNMLQQATKNDPKFTDAQVALEWAKKQPEKAKKTEAAKAAPAELPPGHPAIEPSSSNDGAIHVTLNLDLSAKPAGGVIFIIARAEGETGGHPVAAKRVAMGTFPMTIDLTSADSMMGQPLPAKVRIEARLDSDGDVGTRNPSDPSDTRDGVALGGTINLTLRTE